MADKFPELKISNFMAQNEICSPQTGKGLKLRSPRFGPFEKGKRLKLRSPLSGPPYRTFPPGSNPIQLSSQEERDLQETTKKLRETPTQPLTVLQQFFHQNI